MKKLLVLIFILFVQTCFTQVSLAGGEIITKKMKGDYFDISANIRSAIAGQGLNVAHVLAASSMLHRTGSAFGYKNDIYSNAQIFEFCSAEISQKLSRANPDNITLCPFTISVYSLAKEPGYVRLSYRLPVGKPGAEEIVQEVVALIEKIIEDAQW